VSLALATSRKVESDAQKGSQIIQITWPEKKHMQAKGTKPGKCDFIHRCRIPWRVSIRCSTWHCADAFSDAPSVTLTKGPAFKNLPLPKARVEGRYQWELPIAIRKETLLQRALVGAPLLLICYGAIRPGGITIAQRLPLLRQAAKTSLFHVGDGSTIEIPFNIFGVPSIDGLLKSR
jgi:hypothetical protein